MDRPVRVCEVAPAPGLARQIQPSALVVPPGPESTIQPVSASLRVRVWMPKLVIGRDDDSAGLVQRTRMESCVTWST